jgi:hypothetical protein
LSTKIITNTLELNIQDVQMFRSVAYFMFEVGSTDEAISIFRRVQDKAPGEPQSFLVSGEERKGRRKGEREGEREKRKERRRFRGRRRKRGRVVAYHPPGSWHGPLLRCPAQTQQHRNFL